MTFPVLGAQPVWGPSRCLPDPVTIPLGALPTGSRSVCRVEQTGTFGLSLAKTIPYTDGDVPWAMVPQPRPSAAVSYLVSGLEALPNADEVQAVQPCALGLLIQFIFHVSSVLGVHVLPAATHDHLRDKGAITPTVLNCPEAPGVPAWKADSRVWVEM